jgi:hypothetical protein
MGTNFYTMDGEHIGKRSAAGYYCFDCGITLCKQGNGGIHMGKSEWFDSCPFCGKEPKVEKHFGSAAALELGFNKKASEKKTGVRSCSSFSWSIKPEKLKRKRKVKDEYDRIYQINVFWNMVRSYPIHYFHFLGQWFR